MSFFDDIGKSVSNAFSTTSQALYGYNPTNGKWDMQNSLANKGKTEELKWAGYDPATKKFGSSGSAPSWVGEGFGELTGRNQSRAALNFAKDQYADAQKQAQDLITQSQWSKQQGDMQSSMQARAATLSGQNSGPTYATSTPQGVGAGANLGSGGKDFLGL